MLIPNNEMVVTTISTLIQLSVAPVFLLAGVAGLLNVFTSRLTRSIDKLEQIDAQINKHHEQNNACDKESEFLQKRRDFLIKRMKNINFAIFFATATGLMIAFVIISVFFSSLFDFNSELFISLSFIFAMFFLIISLILFLREIYFTNSLINLKKVSTHT
jgi:small-conductance mechanosensitive channel